MLTIWFWLVAWMITAYVVLDGFDLGIGVLHLFLARTEEDRRLLIRTIGPVWDGNEVWLVAGGGTLYFAFPVLYASGFSGFYLPLMIVLWLLIFRGIGIEFRMQLDSPVWRGFFDGAFGIASLLLIVFFGGALGNVIRGVPLDRDGYFFLPLWTDWRVGLQPGILDWYTVIAAVVALIALSLHGANYAVLKTSGGLNARARMAARRLWPPLLVATIGSLGVTLAIRPELLRNYQNAPALYIIPAMVAASLVGMRALAAERAVFLCSCAYLVFMLTGAAAAVYPNLLSASGDASLNITIYNAHAGDHALSIGLIWWGIGIALAIGYFIFEYRRFSGKISVESSGSH
jgi:cytochrome bd ubiquinol oxidase subunit II